MLGFSFFAMSIIFTLLRGNMFAPMNIDSKQSLVFDLFRNLHHLSHVVEGSLLLATKLQKYLYNNLRRCKQIAVLWRFLCFFCADSDILQLFLQRLKQIRRSFCESNGISNSYSFWRTPLQHNTFRYVTPPSTSKATSPFFFSIQVRN